MACAKYQMTSGVGRYPLHVRYEADGVIYSTISFAASKDVSLYIYNPKLHMYH